MTDRADALRALIEKVEAGELPDYHNPSPFQPLGFRHAGRACSAYRGSLDAAKALHEAVLPGWTLTFLGQDPYDWTAAVFCERHGPSRRATVSANPARAWLLAILKALLAQEEET